MKRLLVSILACLMAIVGLAISAPADASASPATLPGVYLADASASAPFDKDLLTQLETEILPQLEAIFTPEQSEQFKANIADGVSFRKAFKSLMLTPEQKTQLKTVLKSVPKKDAFASLTPDQKKQLFMKKKEMFMPTSEEITDRISAGMKAKGTFLPEGVKEKIDAGMKKKDAFIPTPESITEKIKAGMEKPENGME